MKNGRKKYYPNRWKQYKDAPDEMFIPHEFEELMEHKVHNWQLKPTVEAVVRVKNLNTSKVKEYSYQRVGFIQNRIEKLLESGERYEITIATPMAVDLFLTDPDDVELYD